MELGIKALCLLFLFLFIFLILPERLVGEDLETAIACIDNYDLMLERKAFKNI